MPNGKCGARVHLKFKGVKVYANEVLRDSVQATFFPLRPECCLPFDDDMILVRYIRTKGVL